MDEERFQRQTLRALAIAGVAPPPRIGRLGGTTGATAWAEGEYGRIVVRRRPLEFSLANYVRFDHACLGRMAGAGFLCPFLSLQNLRPQDPRQHDVRRHAPHRGFATAIGSSNSFRGALADHFLQGTSMRLPT